MRLQPRNRFDVDSDYEILASLEVVREVTNGITIDASKVPAADDGSKIVKKGMPMAKITGNGKYRPYTGTALASDTSENDTTAVLADASRYIVGDVITFVDGSKTVQKTISQINYETNIATVSVAFTDAQEFVAANTIVYTTDGGENPTVILKRAVDVKNGDHVVAGFEVAKVIAARIPVTVDATLREKMPHIVFA